MTAKQCEYQGNGEERVHDDEKVGLRKTENSTRLMQGCTGLIFILDKRQQFRNRKNAHIVDQILLLREQNIEPYIDF